MSYPTEAASLQALSPEPLVFRSIERRGIDLGPENGVDRRGKGGVDRRDPTKSGSPLDRREQPHSHPAEPPMEAAVAVPGLDLVQMRLDAHEQGLREGMARAEAHLGERVEQERQGVVRALEEFVREKQRYFAGLEKEVVRLSLAIAERVLHRESAMDPMLLAGAARVALEQVNDDSTAVLRTAPDEAAMWEAVLRREGRTVKVCGDTSLSKGQCLLEAANGTIELGIRSQLAEIEHGFFELLGRNPSMSMQGA